MKSTGNFGKKGWLMIFYCMLLFMVSSAGTDTSNIFYPALAEFNGWPYATLTAAALPASVLSGFIVAAVGTVIKKKGVKFVTLINLVAVAVIQLLQAFAPSLPIFMVTVVLITIATVSLNLCCAQTLISNWFPRKKGVALGWATAGMCLSGVILVPIINAMVYNGQRQTWPAYVLLAVISIVLLVITFGVKSYPEEAGYLPDNEPITDAERIDLNDKKTMQGALTDRQIAKCGQTWFLMFGFGILFMGLMGVVIMTVPRLTAVGMDQNLATMWFSISTLMGFVASVVWGYIDQIWGTKPTSILFAILWAVMLALCSASALLGSIPLGIASVILFGCLMGGLGNLFPSAVIWVFGRREFPNVNRFISAGVALIRALGVATMSICLAISGTDMAAGFGRGYLILTVLTVLGVILIACLNRDKVPVSDPAAR